MATAGFKDTISNGLVFCLDAANPKSYSGSGTSWLDLVSRVNVVLSNISFSSGNVYGVFSGGVASIRCYNRSLSADEVLQNYNSMKVRFI